MKKLLKILIKLDLIVLFFVLTMGVLLLSLSGVPGNGSTKQINAIKNAANSPFESSLTRGRFALVKSVVDEGTVVIDSYATTTFPDVIYSNGHYYSVFVPGAAELAMPLYALGEKYNLGVIAVNLLGPLSLFLTAIIIIATLRILKINFAVTLLSTFVMIFGTQLYTFSTIFNAHYLSAFAIALAFLATALAVEKNEWGLGFLIFWLAFGLGTVVDYPNALTLIPFGILLFFKAVHLKEKNQRKHLSVNIFYFASAIGALIFFTPLFMYIHTLFGTYFTTIEPHQINGYFDHGKVNYHLAADPRFYLDKQIQYKTLNLNEQYLPMGLFTNLFSPPRGLFLYSPVFVLFFFGVSELLKKNKDLTLAIGASIIITFLAYSSYADYAGGWAFGPRFLIGILPLLTVFLAFAIQRYIFKISFLIIFVATGIVSIGIATLGALTSKLLVSPIENHKWGFDNSFLANISQIRTEHYVSFVYDSYLKHSLSHEQFFFSIVITLFIFFMLLTQLSIFSLHKQK